MSDPGWRLLSHGSADPSVIIVVPIADTLRNWTALNKQIKAF
jgi:hypothetical protein